jgi:hypothetical protein
VWLGQEAGGKRIVGGDNELVVAVDVILVALAIGHLERLVVDVIIVFLVEQLACERRSRPGLLPAAVQERRLHLR